MMLRQRTVSFASVLAWTTKRSPGSYVPGKGFI